MKWFTAVQSEPESKPVTPVAADIQTAPPAALNAVPVRVKRVRILNVGYPAVVVEATPDAARDLQDIPGIKQVQPDPADCEPDACGSLYFTVVVSALYELTAISAAIEALNERDAVPDPFAQLFEVQA